MIYREINIRIRVPALLKRRWAAIVAIGCLVVCAVAYAADFTPFAVHEALSSSKMNQNFQSLQDRIAALETTAGGHYCGVLNVGNITGGYPAANLLCKNSALAGCAANPNAHVCRVDEVLRADSAGMSILGCHADGENDCQSFTNPGTAGAKCQDGSYCAGPVSLVCCY